MGFAGGDELESPQVVNSGWITVFPWMEAHLYWKGIRLVNKRRVIGEKDSFRGPIKTRNGFVRKIGGIFFMLYGKISVSDQK